MKVKIGKYKLGNFAIGFAVTMIILIIWKRDAIKSYIQAFKGKKQGPPINYDDDYRKWPHIKTDYGNFDPTQVQRDPSRNIFENDPQYGLGQGAGPMFEKSKRPCPEGYIPTTSSTPSGGIVCVQDPTPGKGGTKKAATDYTV